MNSLQPQEQQEIQRNILDAAMQRFRHYGYNKTTMAEIAGDVGMSAANLYRYFDNKEKIAIASCQYLAQTQIDLARAAINKHKSATKRFHAFVNQVLDFNYKCFSNQTRLYELAHFIKIEKPTPLLETLDRQRQLLKEILDYGIETREFDVPDTQAKSKLLFALSESLGSPSFMVFFPNETFNQKISEISETLIKSVLRSE